jgi:diguanylate cyclase (GGDEF)-like protein/PAS domain S-box-containing protein
MGQPTPVISQLVQRVPGLLAAVDRGGMFTFLSPSWEEVLGHTRAELVEHSLLDLLHPDELDAARAELMTFSIEPSRRDVRLRRADGTYRWVQWEARWDGDLMFVTALDIDSRVAREQEALHDPMTGLASQALALDRLNAALDRLRRRGGAVVILIVDVDDLGAVNETQGYAEGDALLRAIGERLNDRVRRSDTVARIGGDRFMVIADDVQADQPGSLETVIERVSHSFARPFRTRAALTMLSASIGVSVSRDGAADAEQLIREADTALARAKGQGPGRAEVFDAALAEEVRTRIQLASELRGALQRGELRVVFQPLFAIDGGSALGCEALLRWQHPERGELLPQDFLRIAEDDGLIVPIGAWVLEQACSQLACWRAEGYELTMSVNVSARQLEQRDFAAIVERVLHMTGVAPETVCLEVTETAVIRRPDIAARALESLQAIGVRVALDDFGLGYSSLNHLKALPVDVVKVDRSFVADVCTSTQDLAVVEAVLTIAKRMGVTVVAEGVETKAQADVLRGLGCPVVQGFLYGRPVRAADMALECSAESVRGDDTLAA